MKTNLTVVSNRLNEFKSKILKINKKAAKFGMSELTYEISEPIKIKYIEHDRVKYVVKYPVTVYGDIPVFNGWKVVASLDHTHDVTLARVFSDKDVSEIKNRKVPVCDHCHAHKIKRWSFIIENDKTGEMKQVGKSCVKDYIPNNVENAFQYLSWTKEISEFDDDSGGSQEFYFDVNEVIAAGYYSIKNFGFKPSSYESPTYVDVLNYFLPSKNLIDYYNWDIKTREIKDFVDSFLEFFDSKTDSNNFITMVRDIISIGVVSSKNISYIVGAIPSVIKDAESKVEKDNFVNEWVGEVKKRQEFDVILTSVITSDGYYGKVYIHKFLDDKGHTLIWFANGTGVDAEVGDKMKIRGTVKKHDEYRGLKQTILNRVVMI